jgi:hypothetical protein
MYVNGKLLSLPETMFEFSIPATEFYIGGDLNITTPNNCFNGLISEVALTRQAHINGNEVNFSYIPENTISIPSTVKVLTPETYFLINSFNLQIYDLTGITTIQVNGDIEVVDIDSTYTPNYRFTGNNSGLKITPLTYNNQFEFLKDFTIEFWLKYDEQQNKQFSDIFQILNATTGQTLFPTPVIGIRCNNNSKTLDVNIGTSNQGVIYLTSQNYSMLHTWQHLALVRYNGHLKLFISGQEKKLTETPYPDPIYGAELFIGSTNSFDTTLVGNIYGFRITKDQARYTGSFTPPLILDN